MPYESMLCNFHSTPFGHLVQFYEKKHVHDLDLPSSIAARVYFALTKVTCAGELPI